MNILGIDKINRGKIILDDESYAEQITDLYPFGLVKKVKCNNLVE